MIPIEAGKAKLTKIDFEILNYLEYPKTIEQIREEFEGVNVEDKLRLLMGKSLIVEKDSKYLTKFSTPAIQKTIDSSNLPDDVKRCFKTILSKLDIPVIRYSVYDYETKKRINFILKALLKSHYLPLNMQEITRIRMYILDLMERVK